MVQDTTTKWNRKDQNTKIKWHSETTISMIMQLSNAPPPRLVACEHLQNKEEMSEYINIPRKQPTCRL